MKIRTQIQESCDLHGEINLENKILNLIKGLLMDPCDEYNQYYSEIVGPAGGVDKTKCFDGRVYKDQKPFQVNSYKDYNGQGYYDWVNGTFGKYTFNKENYDDPEYDDDGAYNLLCNSSVYSLKQQQKFAGRIMNTHTDINSMLIYHGLGSGKTQTSIVIGEAFKFRKTNRSQISGRSPGKVLIVVPAALRRQYFFEIVGRFESGQIKSAPGEIWISGQQQYYTTDTLKNSIAVNDNDILKLRQQIFDLTNSRTPDYDLIERKEQEIKKLLVANEQSVKEEDVKVSTVYEITSHEKFLNQMFKIEENIFVEQEDTVVHSFLKRDNGLLIIDEIQNLISESGTNYRRLLYSLRYVANPKFRCVFLTGTPIYDKPYEFGLLMNALRPRVVFPESRDEFDKLFIHNDQFVNRSFFKQMCSGYISYFKGGNPLAYPRKKTIIMKHQMEEYQYTQYKIALVSEVEKDQKNIFNKKKPEDIYSNAQKENLSTGIFNTSNQVCNIAFPQATVTAQDLAGGASKTAETQLKKNLSTFKTLLEAELKKHTNLPKVEINLKILAKVREFSSKMAKVAELILECPGTVFVYSNYVYYGVDAMAIIMEALGYSSFPRRTPGLRYFVWKGETNDNNSGLVNNARTTFNDPANADGSLLKVIFGTQTVMEGVDFKNVNQVHVLDPWWNDSRMQQVIARGVRLCSHRDLPPEYRFVNVFIHLSTLGSYEKTFSFKLLGNPRTITSKLVPINPDSPPREWNFHAGYSRVDKEFDVEILVSKKTISFREIDLNSVNIAPDQSLNSTNNWKGLATRSVQEYMYSRALEKLKLNRQFEQVIKESAVDCSLNGNGNITRLNELYIPYPNSSDTWNLVYENYSSGQTYRRDDLQILSLSEILGNKASEKSNLTLRSDDGTPVRVNKMLIVPEDIVCNTGEYTFGFPEKIVDLTINKEMVPILLRMDKLKLATLLRSIQFNRTFRDSLGLIDKSLEGKISRFLSTQKELKERNEIIDQLTQLGFQEIESGVWDQYTITELKSLLAQFKK
jgi:superfamily II DNA or RNA helicase